MAKQRTPEGPPPPPVVQRLRLRYAKRGRLRFTSHRDFQRAFERALRRAAVPMAYSAGFSPHPKISYVGAAPTGVASEAEYLEIGLTEPCDPEVLRARLDAALPPGLDILEIVTAQPDAEPATLAERITGSLWELRLPGVAPAEAAEAAATLLETDSVLVERLTKNGRRQLDARAALVDLALAEDALLPRAAEADPVPCAIMRLVVQHVTPAVRPDDVLTALGQVAGLTPPSPPAVTRVAQGLLDPDGRLADPLAPDRVAAAEPVAAGAAEASPLPAGRT